jgi:hypothetical protein
MDSLVGGLNDAGSMLCSGVVSLRSTCLKPLTRIVGAYNLGGFSRHLSCLVWQVWYAVALQQAPSRCCKGLHVQAGSVEQWQCCSIGRCPLAPAVC